MKTLSTVSIALVSMLGVASAQPATTPAKPATPATPAKGAPAAAAPKADAKAATPATPATPAKPADAGPQKPPAELAAMIKGSGGTWRCNGNALDMTMTMAPMKATMKTKASLDGWWAQESFEGAQGKTKFKMESFTTYDASSKKWRRVSIDNMGSQMVGTSDGPKDGKVVFNLDTVGGMGAGAFRDTVDMTNPKEVKASGEMSMDKGKTWQKVYEMTCKK